MEPCSVDKHPARRWENSVERSNENMMLLPALDLTSLKATHESSCTKAIVEPDGFRNTKQWRTELGRSERRRVEEELEQADLREAFRKLELDFAFSGADRREEIVVQIDSEH